MNSRALKLPSPRFSCGPGFVSALAAVAVTAALHAAELRTVPGLGLKLMPIPAGTFTMGSPATEPERRENEGPQTQVTISHPFWLGQTEVTHGQWRAIMGTDLVEQTRRMPLADPASLPLCVVQCGADKENKSGPV